ncbi:MAG: hypothetical protein INR71_05610 [Terriglobus roseus]|nr:hypothetical protein [Terriglobus roseus]
MTAVTSAYSTDCVRVQLAWTYYAVRRTRASTRQIRVTGCLPRTTHPRTRTFSHPSPRQLTLEEAEPPFRRDPTGASVLESFDGGPPTRPPKERAPHVRDPGDPD